MHVCDVCNMECQRLIGSKSSYAYCETRSLTSCTDNVSKDFPQTGGWQSIPLINQSTTRTHKLTGCNVIPSPHAQARHYVSLTQGTNPNIAGGTSGSLGGWETPFGSLGGETGTDVCADMSCAALTIVRPLEIVVDAILTVRVDLAIEAPCLEAIRDVIIGLD